MRGRRVCIAESQQQLLWIEQFLEEQKETFPLVKRVAALRLYQQGYSAREIAAILGRSASWVSRQLVEYQNGGMMALLQWRGQAWGEVVAKRLESEEVLNLRESGGRELSAGLF